MTRCAARWLGRRYWRGDEAAAIERAAALLERFGLDGLRQQLRRRPQRRPAPAGRDHAGADGRARMLLLDEPMAGVHPNLARRIGGELIALCRGD